MRDAEIHPEPLGIPGGCRDALTARGGGDHTGAGGCLGEAVIPWETLWREGPCSLAGAACPWRTAPRGRVSHAEAVVGGLTACGRDIEAEVLGGLLL